MPRKPISFELDFMIKDIFPRFTVKQFDDVSFNIKPLNQGLEYDTSNMIGKIYVGVNNDMFMQTTDITVSSDNINVLLDKNMLQKNGRAYAEIELTDEDGTITSSSFIFDIDPKIGEGGMIPGEYEGFVEKYERLISEFKAQINSNISNSNDLVDKAIKNCNTSIDNKLNTVDTRLNTKFSEVDNKLNTVDNRVNAKISEVDTKLSTVDSRLNSKVSEVDTKLDTVDRLIIAKVSDFENRFNKLTSLQQQDAEVIDAREGEVSLKARLDKDIENPKKLYTSIEGTEISVDSLEGYLKDIEILGNTVQDQDNLADIRSVGDKLENQELYEIPVLSYGKNLFDKSNANIGYVINPNTGELLADTTNGNCSSDYIRIFADKKYSYNKRNSGGFGIYDLNKNFVEFSSLGSAYITNHSFGVDGYIRLNIGKEVLDTFQLEEGTQATPYEPYVEHKLTILSPVQLEKVGEVADRIVCKDGVWGVEKNVETVTFNGSEVWQYNANSDDNLTNTIRLNTKLKTTGIETVSIMKNFKFLAKTSVDEEGHAIKNVGANVYIRINKTRLSTADAEGFKLYLNSNPVTIYYQTTQPTFIPLPHDQQVALRTFANKTNISFECEIEPTLKASVPKSLGATVNSHSEQIDNLGKELDRVKKLEESTVSTVTTESDFINVENTSNGYFEDVKLEGRTLVNLFESYYKGSSFWSNNTYSTDEQGYIIANANGSFLALPRVKVDKINIKANTEYTVLVDIKNNSLNDVFYVSYKETTVFDKTIQLDAKSVGIYKYKLTSMADISNSSLILRTQLSNNCTEGSIAYRIALLEGDHTQNPPEFFEGIKSVGQDVDEISVLSANKEETKEDKKRILYYNEETDTWEKPVLCQWDSIEKHSDGKYYYHKRSGKVVLNGSEGWYLTSGNSTDNNLWFYIPMPSDAIKRANILVICDKFKHETNISDINIRNNNEFIATGNSINLNISKSKLSTQDLAGFKAWLQANPTTVVYQLAEEKVYECTDLDLITYSGETNLLVKSGVLNPKITLKVKKGIGNVVTLLQNKVAMLEDLVNKLIQSK